MDQRSRPHSRPVRAHARVPVHPARRHPFNETAFADLVRPHIPALVRVARRYVRCSDLAWDAVQETLVSLWQTETMPPEPRPWLFRTVIHRCLHLRRTRQRRSSYEAAAACAACDDADSAGGTTAIEREQLAMLLQQAIATLPAEQRTVFILREIEHADYDAIAHTAGVPVGTVRSRLHRARAALRRWLLQSDAVAGGPPSRTGT